MYKAPFHRQILPWLYVAIFFATAPILIFYTAGYRWNQKKGQIERNGTLIVDATPRGATVWIDGVETGKTTPVTFQDIAPGWHTLRLSKSEFLPWEKNLLIRAEQVSFANNVWLWRESPPTKTLSVTSTGVWSNPIGDRLALAVTDAGGTSIGWWAPEGALVRTKIPTLASSTSIHLSWREDGEGVIINGRQRDEAGWWTAPGSANVESLPPAAYRWNGNDIQGLIASGLLTLRTAPTVLTRETLPTNVVDREDSLFLVRSSTTQALNLEDRSLLHRTFALPQGNWRFAGSRGSFQLLQDGERWLALRPRFGEPYAGTAIGDEPRWLDISGTPTALLVSQNELWLWRLGEDASLLWRQSAPIVQTLWHHSGTSVFIATQNGVFALELDERDGRRVTQLASFDEVNGFAMLNNDLYVSAKKDGQAGLWKLVIE